jgi:hypothetical protein
MALQFVNPFSLLKAGTYIKNAKQYTALKKQLQKADDNPDTEIIGVSGFSFMERTIKASDLSTPVINGLTETVDSTSYPDRAIISLTNSLGYNAYITNFIIDGQPITRYKGAIVHDSLRRDDDIRRNGESLFELGNEYVIDATQATRLADYWYKNLGKKKHVYSVSIPGFAPWYSPGDWYTLSLGSAGTNEYISSTVECYDVQCSRTAGDIGSTTLMLREVEENWTKTTLYAARAVTGGSPKRRSQQSNTLIVAASTFDGTYDYKCDGTADDVEIQAAIDYVYYTFGGGTIQMTGGTFIAAATITMRDNIVLQGVGSNTVISPYDNSITTVIDFGTAINARIKDFCIDGQKASITFATNAMKVVDGQGLGKAENITTRNYKFSNTSGSKVFHILYDLVGVLNCVSYSSEVVDTDAGATMAIYSNCKNLSGCYSSNNASDSCVVMAFNACVNMANCIDTNNDSSAGAGLIYSFYECINVGSCSSTDNTTSGASGYIASFYSCSNIAGCRSYNNTTSGAGALIYGYILCTRVVGCSTDSNAAALTDEYGYAYCKSVQQCKSSGDSIPYGTGATQSYADAGTSNACADTAAGGYNS